MTYLRVSPKTGLTDSDILDIRLAYENGKSIQNLADDYLVGKSTIADIVARKTWAHVPEPTNLKGLTGYLVLPDGRIYSEKSKKTLKSKINKSKLVVELTVNGKSQTVEVASLVAKAFHNATAKSRISFVDGNEYNAHLTNISL